MGGSPMSLEPERLRPAAERGAARLTCANLTGWQPEFLPLRANRQTGRGGKFPLIGIECEKQFRICNANACKITLGCPRE